MRKLAHQRGSGVVDVGGHYETKRAVMAGRQVAQEAAGVKADAVLVASTSEPDARAQSPSSSNDHSR